jgi:hypothetical protein
MNHLAHTQHRLSQSYCWATCLSGISTIFRPKTSNTKTNCTCSSLVSATGTNEILRAGPSLLNITVFWHEMLHCYETLVIIYCATQRHISDGNCCSHCCGMLKSHAVLLVYDGIQTVKGIHFYSLIKSTKKGQTN